MTSSNFSHATIVECDFSNAILNGTDFSYGTIEYSNFQDADFAGAVLLESDFSNSDLSSSENLNASRFDESTIWPDNENLPHDFDSSISRDLASMQDDEDIQESIY